MLLAMHRVICVLIIIICVGCNSECGCCSKRNNQQPATFNSKTMVMDFESIVNDGGMSSQSPIDPIDSEQLHLAQFVLASTNMASLLSQYIEALCVLRLGEIQFLLDIGQHPFQGQHAHSNHILELTREASRTLVNSLAMFATADKGIESESDGDMAAGYLAIKLKFSRKAAINVWSASRRRPRAASYQQLIREVLSQEEKTILDVMTSYFTSILFQELCLKRIALLQQVSTNNLTSIVQDLLVAESEAASFDTAADSLSQ